jgi:aerobic carbon-monoxide dehydrogenase large subunit
MTVGARAARARDAALVTGRGRFIADVELPGQVWARFVRAPVHGLLRSVGVDAAARVPGVVAVITAADVPDVRIPIRLEFAATPSAQLALQPLLARDVLRYVGEPVAVVLAEDPWIAEDAAELVELDIELPGDAESPVHESLPSNVVDSVTLRYADCDAAFAAADVVVTRRLRIARQTGAPLETRGLVAEPDATGGITVWGAAKVKHFNREATAELLGLDPRLVRLVEVDVGGGFGVRGELYPEDVVVPLAALQLGRPVKWIEDRAEHLVATNHARGQQLELSVAATADGMLLALRGEYRFDQGAYIRTQGILPALLPAQHLPGPYRWDAFELTAHAVLTNRTPAGTYRGPGMTEAAFARERLFDVLARELGVDPVELRRRNLIRADAMPWVYQVEPPSPPLVYETGDFPAFFERALEAAETDDVPATRDGARIGIGVAATLELGAIGPWEEATVRVERDGSIVVRAGVASLGQGVETALGQIAAAELGVPLERVEVRHHDTRDIESGFGSFASRSTVVAGNAVALACRELVRRAAAEGKTPADVGEVRGRFEKPHPSFSFGASVSVVSVDPITGHIQPQRHVVAHDVGRAVNPALVEGQLVGAALQGIAGALLEELPYDEQQQPLALSFAEYRLPTAAETPDVTAVLIEHGDVANPLGLKSAGEGGIVGAAAAVANAVADALGPAAADLLELPLTPQRVSDAAAPR